MNSVAPFGRVAVIVAPTGGLVSTPILNLYRRGGSIIGVNALLYSLEDCARVLEQIGADFDKGAIPVSHGFTARPLSEGVAAYRDINADSSGKIVLIP